MFFAFAAPALLPASAQAQRVTLAPTFPRAAYAAPSDIGLGTAGNPELDYLLHCQGCHRADGTGTPGAIPELAGHMSRFLSLPEGREYLARVPGVAQSTLDDASLASLLNWMLARFDAANLESDFLPFRADEVGRLRQQPLVRVSEVRERLLSSMR